MPTVHFTFHLAAGKQRRNPATALHLMVAVMLLGIAIAAAFLFWFTSVSPNFQSPYFSFAVFGAVCLVVSIALLLLAVRQRKGQEDNRLSGWVYLELVVLLAGAVLFLWQQAYIPALLFMVMAVAVGLANWSASRKSRGKLISFTEKEIIVPGRLRAYAWREVNKVLYRYGTLTIELTGNRLWQNFATTDADLQIFEAWVNSQIEKYAAERAKEW